MSDHYLSLIPEEPSYLPPTEAQALALEAFRAFLSPDAEIEVEASEDIQFVDQGENFESVSCPACDTEIDIKSWGEWLDKSSESNFIDRSVTMPCCGRETDLNALRYHWPAGFARYILRALDPGIDNRWLEEKQLSALEGILGCKLRQIRTMY
jgi:hypothetical protein